MLLNSPVIYRLKTRILSFGRESVCDYLSGRTDLPLDGRVLDVACGTGSHARVFPGTFCGVDLNRDYLDYARKRSRGTYALVDAARLSFPDESYDLVYSVGLCHHLPDRQVEATAREMKRVTTKGGQTLIIDGVLPPKTNPIGHVLFRLDRGEHVRPLEALQDLLTGEGFELILANIPGSFPYRRAVFSHRK